MAKAPTEADEAIRLVEQVAKYDISKLKRLELGTLSFEPAIPSAEMISRCFQRIPVDALKVLPADPVKQLGGFAQEIINHFEWIKDFNEKGEKPADARKQLIDNISKDLHSALNRLAPFSAWSDVLSASPNVVDLSREQLKALQVMRTEAIAEVEALRAEAKQQLENGRKEIEATLEAAKAVAGRSAAAAEQKHFEEEAELHRKSSRNWLVITVLMALLLATYSAFTFFIHKLDLIAAKGTGEIVQLGISKVLAFAVIAFFLVFATKNFSANRHNWVVNRHRKNSLATYDALVRAASDPQARDIILNKAADSIFGSRSSGFGGGPGEEVTPPSVVAVNPQFKAPSPTGQ